MHWYGIGVYGAFGQFRPPGFCLIGRPTSMWCCWHPEGVEREVEPGAYVAQSSRNSAYSASDQKRGFLVRNLFTIRFNGSGTSNSFASNLVSPTENDAMHSPIQGQAWNDAYHAVRWNSLCNHWTRRSLGSTEHYCLGHKVPFGELPAKIICMFP